MKILIVLTVITVLVMVYVVWLRPLMRKTPWGKRFLDKIEPIERTLWRNSETILFARFKMVMGALLAALTSLGAIDLSPFIAVVPQQHQGWVKTVVSFLPLAITVLGWADEQLRNDTTKPLEIVEMRTDAPPEAKAAAAEAAAANATAVEIAKETGAV